MKKLVYSHFSELFTVALIDIHLPDMDGTELLSKLRKTEPPLKIIITGNTPESTPSGVAFLFRIFSIEN
jgi:CheY-like chemotaxis protein